MKVAFAVEKDSGKESLVYGHFGSAPVFVMYDTERDETSTISNRDLGHSHGACNPMKALGGAAVDAVVVGGIGTGALMRLNAEGIRVYRAIAPTISENIQLLTEGKLPALDQIGTCGGHAGGCGGH